MWGLRKKGKHPISRPSHLSFDAHWTKKTQAAARPAQTKWTIASSGPAHNPVQPKKSEQSTRNLLSSFQSARFWSSGGRRLQMRLRAYGLVASCPPSTSWPADETFSRERLTWGFRKDVETHVQVQPCVRVFRRTPKIPCGLGLEFVWSVELIQRACSTSGLCVDRMSSSTFLTSKRTARAERWLFPRWNANTKESGRVKRSTGRINTGQASRPFNCKFLTVSIVMWRNFEELYRRVSHGLISPTNAMFSIIIRIFQGNQPMRNSLAITALNSAHRMN